MNIELVLSRAIFLCCIALSWGSYQVNAQPLTTLHSGLENATSLYVTQNSIYIVEQGKDRLVKLDHEGKIIDTIGGRGSGNYQFSKPVDVDATNGLKVFITDYNNRRVQVFDRRGQYLSSISASEAFGNNRPYDPTQIAVNALGEVFFVDRAEYYIRHFDLDSNLLNEFRIPAQVKAVHELMLSSREILILDRSTATIHRLSLNGNYRGFIPAEGVRAFFFNKLGMWKAYSDKIVFENPSKETQTITFGDVNNLKPVAMQVVDGNIYLLSSGDLYRILKADP